MKNILVITTLIMLAFPSILVAEEATTAEKDVAEKGVLESSEGPPTKNEALLGTWVFDSLCVALTLKILTSTFMIPTSFSCRQGGAIYHLHKRRQ